MPRPLTRADQRAAVHAFDWLTGLSTKEVHRQFTDRRGCPSQGCLPLRQEVSCSWGIGHANSLKLGLCSSRAERAKRPCGLDRSLPAPTADAKSGWTRAPSRSLCLHSAGNKTLLTSAPWLLLCFRGSHHRDEALATNFREALHSHSPQRSHLGVEAVPSTHTVPRSLWSSAYDSALHGDAARLFSVSLRNSSSDQKGSREERETRILQTVRTRWAFCGPGRASTVLGRC